MKELLTKANVGIKTSSCSEDDSGVPPGQGRGVRGPGVGVVRGSKTVQDNTLRSRPPFTELARSSQKRAGSYNRVVSTPPPGSSPALAAAAEELVRVGRRFDQRGWVMGTSGNFSVVIGRSPLRLAITAERRIQGRVARGSRSSRWTSAARRSAGEARVSAEALLHVEVVRARGAGAVLHTHSIWSTLLSDRYAAPGGLVIAGYEMLKGLEGVRTHEHREWLPIVDERSGHDPVVGGRPRALDAVSGRHGFLLRGHGLYTWGADLPQAVRHVEILEFCWKLLGELSSACGPSAA